MTMSRDLVYSFVNKRGDEMARYGPPAPYHKMIEAGSDDDLYLHGLLNKVEDDRAHEDADRVRAFADSAGTDPTHEYDKYRRGLLLAVANEIDPYEMREGQLVRKSDGKPVT